jgi:hypothetical protein
MTFFSIMSSGSSLTSFFSNIAASQNVAHYALVTLLFIVIDSFSRRKRIISSVPIRISHLFIVVALVLYFNGRIELVGLIMILAEIFTIRLGAIAGFAALLLLAYHMVQADPIMASAAGSFLYVFCFFLVLAVITDQIHGLIVSKERVNEDWEIFQQMKRNIRGE